MNKYINGSTPIKELMHADKDLKNQCDWNPSKHDGEACPHHDHGNINQQEDKNDENRKDKVKNLINHRGDNYRSDSEMISIIGNNSDNEKYKYQFPVVLDSEIDIEEYKTKLKKEIEKKCDINQMISNIENERKYWDYINQLFNKEKKVYELTPEEEAKKIISDNLNNVDNLLFTKTNYKELAEIFKETDGIDKSQFYDKYPDKNVLIISGAHSKYLIEALRSWQYGVNIQDYCENKIYKVS